MLATKNRRNLVILAGEGFPSPCRRLSSWRLGNVNLPFPLHSAAASDRTFGSHPSVPQKKRSPVGNRFIFYLVAGEGFEPTTFGL